VYPDHTIDRVPCVGRSVAENESISPLISEPESTPITLISSVVERDPDDTTGAILEPGTTVIMTVPVFDVAHD
jgi:hypothetical protein